MQGVAEWAVNGKKQKGFTMTDSSSSVGGHESVGGLGFDVYGIALDSIKTPIYPP
jgi:hypothetical protein